MYFKEVKHKLNHGTVEQLILGSILSVLSNKGIFGRSLFYSNKNKICPVKHFAKLHSVIIVYLLLRSSSWQTEMRSRRWHEVFSAFFKWLKASKWHIHSAERAEKTKLNERVHVRGSSAACHMARSPRLGAQQKQREAEADASHSVLCR